MTFAVTMSAACVGLIAGLVVATGSIAGPTPDGSQLTNPVNDQGWTAPAEGFITSTYMAPNRPDHLGTDIANAEGTPIWAASSGTVAQAACTSSDCTVREVGDGCGWTVRIDHGGGIATRYCHLRDRPLITAGDTVSGGQQLGDMGSTGHSTGDHLHFECYTGGFTVDCEPFMGARGVTL